MSKKKIGIVGGAGYVGGEAIRLILNHPQCEIEFVTSRSQEGKNISDVHPDLIGQTQLKFTAEYNTNVDVIFICMGHGQTVKYLEKVLVPEECVVIDLSRDFRLKEDAREFIYGLCELNKDEIKRSHRIANPGCFATCIQLGLLPFAQEGLLTNEIHITAITGSTGAGQKPLPTTHNSWRNNNISIYKAFTHQHLGEIKQSIIQLQGGLNIPINFIPMRGSFTRGIFSNIYFNCSESIATIFELFESYYGDSPFVHISTDPISVKQVVNTNNALIHISKHDGKVRVESIIDNLLKGAAGQAVQNMNLIMGWSEDLGLKLKATAF